MINKNFIAEWMTTTNGSLIAISIFLLRCTAGIILFEVGSGKVLGWFGGLGMDITIMYFSKMGFSAFLTYLSSYTEFIGGILLFSGLFTRPAATAVFINMLVATIVMWPKGFIKGGADFPFTIMIISAVIILTGPMAVSLDSLFIKRLNKNN